MTEMFCLDCSCIGTNTRQCEACGSRALYPVRAWLERKPVVEDRRETAIERYWREEEVSRCGELKELEKMWEK